MKRSKLQKIQDFITFPFRAFFVLQYDKWKLPCLKTERFDYVSREVKGYCLDVGCCRYNEFIRDYCDNNGKGIDVYPYAGLSEENIVKKLTKFPFENETFDSVTFIANINHIPPYERDIEITEAYRCLKYGGNIIIQTANPLASILAHKVSDCYDFIFGTLNADSERGMHKDETLFVTEKEVMERLKKAGFKDLKKKYFTTQWFLNRLYVGWKKSDDNGFCHISSEKLSAR
jgi:SAM-dependent methyltransferase